MAISAQNEYYEVWQDFLDGKYTLCITNFRICFCVGKGWKSRIYRYYWKISDTFYL